MEEGLPKTAHHFDQAILHPWTFLFILLLGTAYILGKLAHECEPSLSKLNLTLKVSALLNFWVILYLAVFNLLASITTAMALVMVFDGDNEARITFMPPVVLPLAAAALGVFGFEFLVRKFIIGFGENKFDLETTMSNLASQAQAATILKAAQ